MSIAASPVLDVSAQILLLLKCVAASVSLLLMKYSNSLYFTARTDAVLGS